MTSLGEATEDKKGRERKSLRECDIVKRRLSAEWICESVCAQRFQM